MGRDDAEAVAGFARLGLIATDNWPMVAAWLLDSGFEGASLVALAALDTRADAWDVDPLHSESLQEISAPVLDEDRAALIVGSTVEAAGRAAEGHPVVRRLTAIASSLDYPGGLIGECYTAEEYADCECHPDGRREAAQLEHRLRTTLTLHINPGLAQALIQSFF